MNKYEEEFIKIYGIDHFYELYDFIKENDIADYYNKARDNPIDLFNFGFHYGLISIVAFCYCQLKLSLEIHEVINGYFKTINSTTPEFTETEGKRQITSLGVPILHRPGANDGITIATIDKFTPMRKRCMEYLLRMIKFSKYQMKRDKKNLKYVYTIVDKYIEGYRLLDVR